MNDGRWWCKECRRRISATVGTILQRTKTPLTVWFANETGPVAFDETTGELERFFNYSPSSTQDYYATLITGTFEFFGFKHTVLAGGDYYRRRYQEDNLPFVAESFGNAVFPLSIPDIFNHSGTPGFDKDALGNTALASGDGVFFFQARDEWYGFHFQDQLNLNDRIFLVAGIRWGVQGFSASLGGVFQSFRFGDRENSFILPGFGRLDAGLKYTHDFGASRATLRFDIRNLTGKEYFATSSSRLNITPATPRTYLGSVSLEH